MKKLILRALMATLVFSILACSKKDIVSNAAIPAFPYEEYLDSISETGNFPLIGDDGRGFDAISNKIRYAELPEKLSSNLFADSLLQLYNLALAFNTVAYDVSTAERYIDDSDLVKAHAQALDSVNLSGIRNADLRNSLAKVSHDAAKWLHQGEKPNQHETASVGKFYEVYDGIYKPFIDSHISDEEYAPADVLKGYEDIHSKAISDTTSFRSELLQKVLNEKDFEKKCILAREFAYANYRNPERDELQLVAVLDPILRANEYSPLLGELWLMWRTALQKNILSGPSNDSAIYNLFYNDMRNRVVLAYISHLAENPKDKVAFGNFYRLALEYNITRNSGAAFGNNSILDEAELYYDIWNKDK